VSQQMRRRTRNWLRAGVLSLGGARRCPLCGGPCLPAGASHMHAHLSCRSCGLIFVADLPPAEDLRAAYQRVHESDFQVAHKTDWAPFLAHKALTLDQLGVTASVQGARALDLGCGEGALLGLLEQRGFSAWGLELNPVMAAQARGDGYQAVEGSLEDAAPPAGLPWPFALVLMNHVIEHLRRPDLALRRIHDWLAPGGSLVLETPMSPDYSNIDHLYYFSAAALERLLRATGLTPVAWIDYVDDNYGHHNIACRAVKK
jgi:SAM-dependent methyltransferase